MTGGNAGVGLATAEALLQHGAGTVVLACRSQERGAAAAAHLAAAVGGAGAGGRVEVEALDLADLQSVRAFARRWADSGRPLDLLVLNAGIMCPPDRVETADGFELQFQVGHGVGEDADGCVVDQARGGS